MKRFMPSRYHLPSASCVAFRRTDCRSEPESGSVRSMEPSASPVTKRGMYFWRCSSEPNSQMVSAMSCRPKRFCKLASARETISVIIV